MPSSTAQRSAITAPERPAVGMGHAGLHFGGVDHTQDYTLACGMQDYTLACGMQDYCTL